MTSSLRVPCLIASCISLWSPTHTFPRSRDQAKRHLENETRFNSLDQSLRRFIERVAAGEAKLEVIIDRTRQRICHVVEYENRQTRTHFDNSVADLRVDAAETAEQMRFLDSLRWPDLNARKSMIKPPHTTTFEWVFNDSIQRPWDSVTHFLGSDGPCYWIQGKPGSGKSCLMKFISENERTMHCLRQWKPEKQPIVLSFYFWLVGSPLQRTSKGL